MYARAVLHQFSSTCMLFGVNLEHTFITSSSQHIPFALDNFRFEYIFLKCQLFFSLHYSVIFLAHCLFQTCTLDKICAKCSSYGNVTCWLFLNHPCISRIASQLLQFFASFKNVATTNDGSIFYLAHKIYKIRLFLNTLLAITRN